MGTDIHEALEVRDAPGEPWRKVGEVFPYIYFSPDRPKNERHDFEDGDFYISNPEFVSEPFQARNYNVFALFADVRNGTGFAGVETGSRITPIAEPRGIPDDVSPETKEFAERTFDHTPSWLMLSEILDYDYDVPYRYTGVVSAEQYEQLLQGTQPEEWSGGISGPRIVMVSEAQYTAYKVTGELPRILDDNPYVPPSRRVLYPGGPVDEKTRIYVQAHWMAPKGLRGALGEHYWKVLAGLAEGYDPDNTRLVFGFDS